jgi:hypothetical protein
MAIQIEASYAKKLGLPNYSSHSFMVTVRAEVSSLRRLETESTRLYQLLQSSVDKQVQQVGFLPDATKYGMIVSAPAVVNGSAPAKALLGGAPSEAGAWKCSENQRSFIEKTAKRMRVSAADLDAVAQHLFKLPAAALDKRQASGLIDELFAMEGQPSRNGAKSARPQPVAG